MGNSRFKHATKYTLCNLYNKRGLYKYSSSPCTGYSKRENLRAILEILLLKVGKNFIQVYFSSWIIHLNNVKFYLILKISFDDELLYVQRIIVLELASVFTFSVHSTREWEIISWSEITCTFDVRRYLWRSTKKCKSSLGKDNSRN